MANNNTAALEEAIRATTEKFLRAYVDATEKHDARVFSETLDRDCRRFIGPEPFLTAMALPQNFSLSNEEYENLSKKDLSTWTITTCQVSNLTVDPTSRKSAARSSYVGKLKDGSEFTRTLAWFLDFSEDGTKITRIYQVNDSLEAKQFRERVEALQ
jgi:hypothetical protein